MAGLINTQVDSTNDAKLPDDPNQVKTVTATSYDPTMRTVDSNQTVAGQLDKVLASDSPLITEARTQASEQANARGLQNSSMAVGAGESAAIAASLPIAQQDAATYGQAASQNQEASNTAGQFGATATNQQADVSAAAINTGQTIKQQTVAQSQLSTQSAQQAESLSRVQGSINSGLSLQDAVQKEAQSRVDAELQAGIITTQEQANARLAQLQGDISSALSSQQASQAQALATLQGQVETGLQTLRGTQSVDLANIEANYKQLMQANSSAASIYNESLQQIATILRDPQTSPEQKQSAVSGVISLLSSGLNVVGSISNLNLGGLLDFSGVTNAAAGASAAPPPPPPDTGNQNTTDFSGA